jgi:hypothetical protein
MIDEDRVFGNNGVIPVHDETSNVSEAVNPLRVQIVPIVIRLERHLGDRFQFTTVENYLLHASVL